MTGITKNVKQKGEPGYISFQKKFNFIMGAGLFAVAILIFVIGLILNDFNKGNLFTVFAALFVIPAAKFAVSFILFFSYKSVTEESYNEIIDICKNGTEVYADVLLASTEKAYSLDYLIYTGDKIFGLTTKKKTNPLDIRMYLDNMISRRGHEMVITITDDESKFKNFLKSSKGLDELVFDSEEDKEMYLAERKEIMSIIETVFI